MATALLVAGLLTVGVAVVPRATASNGHAFDVGAAVTSTQAHSDAFTAAVANRDISMISGQAAVSFSDVEPQQGVFDLSQLDSLVSFAESKGLAVRGGPLLSDGDVPAWFNHLSKDDARAAMELHVKTIVSRYHGRVDSWTVVAHSLGDDGSLRSNVFRQKLGDDYVADVFRWAHEADASAQLFLAENQVAGANARPAKLAGFLTLIVQLQKNSGAIDGVAVELPSIGSSDATQQLRNDLNGLGAMGVSIALAHLPVDNGTATSSYVDVAKACIAVARCTSIWTWGAAQPSTYAALTSVMENTPVSQPSTTTTSTTSVPSTTAPPTTAAPSSAPVASAPSGGVKRPSGTAPTARSGSTSSNSSTTASAAAPTTTSTTAPAATTTTAPAEVLGETIEQAAPPLVTPGPANDDDSPLHGKRIIVAGVFMIALALLLMWFGLSRLRLP